MTSALLPESKVTGSAIAAATLATEPPVVANMVSLAAMRRGSAGPRHVRALVLGSAATSRALSAAKWWGYDAERGIAVYLGAVNDGTAVTISTTIGYATKLEDVVGHYSHLGITGTLAGDSLILEVHPSEAHGG
jgi:hypothetical protein